MILSVALKRLRQPECPQALVRSCGCCSRRELTPSGSTLRPFRKTLITTSLSLPGEALPDLSGMPRWSWRCSATSKVSRVGVRQIATTSQPCCGSPAFWFPIGTGRPTGSGWLIRLGAHPGFATLIRQRQTSVQLAPFPAALAPPGNARFLQGTPHLPALLPRELPSESRCLRPPRQ